MCYVGWFGLVVVDAICGWLCLWLRQFRSFAVLWLVVSSWSCCILCGFGCGLWGWIWCWVFAWLLSCLFDLDLWLFVFVGFGLCLLATGLFGCVAFTFVVCGWLG